ncbi:hypothetical protein E2C01_062120 [Portunus trituberculatus]|uniref:Uncharacterized protein n=1 Tax=Portunus trituberculatus TaxID=210409 RepID=A0A5B7HCR9_PORTR|nr:hypothetical protein [Portunus trituberculatus]
MNAPLYGNAAQNTFSKYGTAPLTRNVWFGITKEPRYRSARQTRSPLLLPPLPPPPLFLTYTHILISQTQTTHPPYFDPACRPSFRRDGRWAAAGNGSRVTSLASPVPPCPPKVSLCHLAALAVVGGMGTRRRRLWGGEEKEGREEPTLDNRLQQTR